MKKYIAILEIEDDCEIVGTLNASVAYTYKENGTNYATLDRVEFKALEQEPTIKFTNSDWIDFLSKQFDISRTSAKEMLHTMMSVKKEDNLKKRFSGRK